MMSKKRFLPKCPDLPTTLSPTVETKVYHIECITPLFGGGVTTGIPDKELPIRVSAIRGMLRFWWRATRGAICQSHDELRKRESEIWGDTLSKSKISIKLKEINFNPYLSRTFSHHALKYVLYPFKGKGSDPNYFLFPVNFSLEVSCPSGDFPEVEAALWAWVNFGGIGARTRRGCGALYCKNFSPSLTSSDPSDLSGLKLWFSESMNKFSISVPQDPPAWPTLATILIHNGRAAPIAAWEKVNELLKSFRQNRPVNPSGRTFWPEADSIRVLAKKHAYRHPPEIVKSLDDVDFPRATLGLPIVMHFKDSGDPEDHTILPVIDDKTQNRMSSPIIVKPLAVSPTQAYPMIVRLNNPYLDDLEVEVHHSVNKGRTPPVYKGRAGHEASKSLQSAWSEPVRNSDRRRWLYRICQKEGISMNSPTHLQANRYYLIAITIGPVQDFIDAARRTRDLWMGSHLLSELSRAAAQALKDKAEPSGAKLIFPVLRPGDRLPVPNKIYISIPFHDQHPKQWIDLARKVIHAKWCEASRQTWDKLEENVKFFSRADRSMEFQLWKSQTNPDDAIEFFAAWTTFDADEPDGYPKAWKRLEHLLAGRKALRNFNPARGEGRDGRRKSSLDGAREAIFPEIADWPPSEKKKLGIEQREYLDAFGWIKRLLGREQKFPSVVRTALDPWIRRVSSEPAGKQGLEEILKLIQTKDAFSWIDKYESNDNHPHPYMKTKNDPFPADASVLLSSRIEVWLKQNTGDTPAFSDTEIRLLHEIRKRLHEQLYKSFGEPAPYVAVLMADGDRMGAVISAMTSPAAHSELSEVVSAFASEAREIILENRGVPVYTGGDDVFAFLPIDTALKTARLLHDRFDKKMAELFPNPPFSPPTLSVGIAIGHCLEPLEDLRAMAKEAEKAAKTPRIWDKPGEERDGLAIVLTPRGGSAIRFRRNWNRDPAGDLHRWIEIFRKNRLSRKTVYDVLQLAEEYRRWKTADRHTPSVELLQGDLLRLLGRKEKAEQLEADMLHAVHAIRTVDDLVEFADLLALTARWAQWLPDVAATPEVTATSEATATFGDKGGHRDE